MDPIPFPEQTKVLAPPREAMDPECIPLPVWTDGAQCVSCWRLTWRERFSALFFGRAWLSVYFGSSQPPVWVQAKRTVFDRA